MIRRLVAAFQPDYDERGTRLPQELGEALAERTRERDAARAALWRAMDELVRVKCEPIPMAASLLDVAARLDRIAAAEDILRRSPELAAEISALARQLRSASDGRPGLEPREPGAARVSPRAGALSRPAPPSSARP